MRIDPIVIFGTPRGGTSLVAGIFVAHGIWVGRPFPGGSGYVNHENNDLKQFIKQNWPLNAGVPMKNLKVANLMQFCQQRIKTEGPWMFKGPAEYYPIFDCWFPAMRPVFVFRNEEQAVESQVRRRGEQVREISRDITIARFKYLRQLLHEGRAGPLPVEISADEAVVGNFKGFAEVLAPYNIEFSSEKALATLQPEKYHL